MAEITLSQVERQATSNLAWTDYGSFYISTRDIMISGHGLFPRPMWTVADTEETSAADLQQWGWTESQKYHLRAFLVGSDRNLRGESFTLPGVLQAETLVADLWFPRLTLSKLHAYGVHTVEEFEAFRIDRGGEDLAAVLTNLGGYRAAGVVLSRFLRYRQAWPLGKLPAPRVSPDEARSFLFKVALARQSGLTLQDASGQLDGLLGRLQKLPTLLADHGVELDGEVDSAIEAVRGAADVVRVLEHRLGMLGLDSD